MVTAYSKSTSAHLLASPTEHVLNRVFDLDLDLDNSMDLSGLKPCEDKLNTFSEPIHTAHTDNTSSTLTNCKLTSKYMIFSRIQ